VPGGPKSLFSWRFYGDGLGDVGILSIAARFGTEKAAKSFVLLGHLDPVIVRTYG
jgi:hypothetical protein